MNKNDVEQLINSLISVSNNQMPLESFKNNLKPNYEDENGNKCFHFLTEYTFKEYCFRTIKIDINERMTLEKYNKLKNDYTQHIISIIRLLLELNCDILSVNKNKQSPLDLSITKGNFILAKEYFKIIQTKGVYKCNDFYNLLNLLTVHGNCFNQESIELINLILFNLDDNQINIFNNETNINPNYKLTPIIISLCKNFSDNIYEKYNEFIKILSLEYIEKDNNNNINVKQDQNIIDNIKIKSFDNINFYINNYFMPALNKLIQLGANLQNNNESSFIYIMSYPYITNLKNFIKDNNIDINFQDKFGNTALIALIYNKKYICQISQKIYSTMFQYFMSDKNLDILKRNNFGKTAFYICLMNDFIEEAVIIYRKYKLKNVSIFNSDILNYIIRNNNPQKIIEFLKYFGKEIDLNLFNIEQKRSLLHYITIYFSGDLYLYTFQQILSFLYSIKIDYLKKDKYDRNFIFYLFLDENDDNKIIDPIQHLMSIFKIFKNINLNDKDIFGNNIMFYIIQSKAVKCLDFLLNNGITLTNEQNNNENSIFSMTLLNNDHQLFNKLYTKINNPSIFSHKIYEPYIKKNFYSRNIDLAKCNKGETLYDFLNKISFDRNLIQKKDHVIENNNNNSIHKFKIQFNVFNYFDFIYNDVLKVLDNYVSNLIIKINNNNEINTYTDIDENYLVYNFIKNDEEYIFERKNCERNIISENLFRYCLSKNYEDICKFIINQKYNLISICSDLIFFNRYKDINDCIQRIITENYNNQNILNNLKNQKGQTIYHLLPFVQNNIQFCNILSNHNISNIFDNNGNTPLYYACENFDINFINIFTYYSFNSNNIPKNLIRYNLFLETNNGKTPLEILYEKINKRDEQILKLIIDISINTKTVYFIHVVKYLIQNYKQDTNIIFKKYYKINLSSNIYYEKIVGLYQFYTQILQGNIMIKDEYGNDPFIICAQNNNYDFIFNILLEEHNILLNSTNNDGKSVIHIILQLSGYLNKYKENILIRAIESGFDFNIKDKEDMLPIDYAYLDEDFTILNILIKYYNNFGIKIPENRHIKPKSKFNYDFYKDSDILYNESILISVKIDKYENLDELVSPLFKYDKLKSFYKVCLDEQNLLPYSVNLVKKDFFYLNELNDKKYCLQIIRDENNTNEYIVLDIDKSSLLILNKFAFNNFISAQNKFKELFKNKTDNDWDNVKNNKLNFKTNYTNNCVFDYTYEEENAIYEYLKITIKNLYIKKKSEYKGNIKIKNLIYYTLCKAYKNKFDIYENSNKVETDTKNVIQNYKSTAIKKAISILFQIKNLLNENNKDEIYFKKRNYLINSYNELIPFSHRSKNLNLFNDYLSIDYEISRITTYYYTENVLKILLGAIYNLNNIHPLDYIINALGCKLEELPKPENYNQLKTEADYIYNYVNTTKNDDNIQINSIYKITESINDKNFNLNNYENRYIFFHGTNVENIIGILSQGLKIAPVQAINTGNAYGNGIYLSDGFSTSFTYCFHSKNGGLFYNDDINYSKLFMIMAEVAVGNIGITADTNVVSMNMDFNDYFMTNEGYRIFKNSNKLRNSDSIIVAHEETNVRVKYLIEIEYLSKN